MDDNNIVNNNPTDIKKEVIPTITPEGVAISIEKPETKNTIEYELSPEVTGLKDTNQPEDIITLQKDLPVAMNLSDIVINKQTKKDETKHLDTQDKISQLADDDEENFIENVITAHATD